jgi:hypothetical protein
VQHEAQQCVGMLMSAAALSCAIQTHQATFVFPPEYATRPYRVFNWQLQTLHDHRQHIPSPPSLAAHNPYAYEADTGLPLTWLGRRAVSFMAAVSATSLAAAASLGRRSTASSRPTTSPSLTD